MIMRYSTNYSLTTRCSQPIATPALVALIAAALAGTQACSPTMHVQDVSAVPVDSPSMPVDSGVQPFDVPVTDVPMTDVPVTDVPAMDAGVRCPNGQELCNGACTYVQADQRNCGSCGTTCERGLLCIAGRCTQECPAGLTLCAPTAGDGGVGSDASVESDASAARLLCVATQSDPRHCGACGVRCGPSQTCSQGTCVVACVAPLISCAGECRDSQTDPTNCGGCGRVCATPAGTTASCTAGQCNSRCNAGLGDCNGMANDGCETPLNSLGNCRACGVACQFANASSTCEMSGCALGACNANFGNCNMNALDGCEANLQADSANCGACGRSCPIGQVCSMGACAAVCRAGLSNCGGSCRDLAADPSHCGICGASCPAGGPNQSAVCSAARCALVCDANFNDCNRNGADGCEVDLRINSAHCGACGNVCNFANAVGTCSAGSCSIAACNPGFANCNNNSADGCEVQLQSDPANCGGCAVLCNNTQACVAGACVAITTSPAPVVIPNSTGCMLLLDTNADQVDFTPDGRAVVLLRCPGDTLRLSVGSVDQRVFSGATNLPTVPIGFNDAAQIFARTNRELFVLLGVTATRELSVLRSTDLGVTWSAPVLIDRSFSRSGPGPAVSLVARDNALFATWSNATAQSPVFKSIDDGASWTSIGPVALAGTNYCPDLLFGPMGELLLANEVNREVFLYSPAMMSWSRIGTVSNPTGFTDFAAGGSWIYGTGGVNSIQRSPLLMVGMNASVSAGLVTGDNARSMDADGAGNLAFAVRITAGTLQVLSWQAGAAAIDAPFLVNTPPAGPNIVATAAHPNLRASVTAIYNTGFVGGHVAVHRQVF